MEAQWFNVALAGTAFVANIVILAIYGTHALARMRESLSRDAEKRQDEVLAQFDTERRMVGETIASIRQELHNVRLHGAETYQRRDSFHQQMTAFNQAMSARFEKIEDAMNVRFEKIESKIDRIYDRVTRGDSRSTTSPK